MEIPLEHVSKVFDALLSKAEDALDLCIDGIKIHDWPMPMTTLEFVHIDKFDGEAKYVGTICCSAEEDCELAEIWMSNENLKKLGAALGLGVENWWMKNDDLSQLSFVSRQSDDSVKKVVLDEVFSHFKHHSSIYIDYWPPCGTKLLFKYVNSVEELMINIDLS